MLAFIIAVILYFVIAGIAYCLAALTHGVNRTKHHKWYALVWPMYVPSVVYEIVMYMRRK